MSRTQKTYTGFKFMFRKDWQQKSNHFCTLHGGRFCGDPQTIDGTKSKNKSKGTHRDKRHTKIDMDM